MSDNQNQSGSSNHSTTSKGKQTGARSKNRIPIKPSEKPSKRPKGTTYPVSVDNYKNRYDGFKISPFFLLGAFITALGAGFLISPNANGLNAPAFETWSLIIIGIIIAIPGAFQMLRDYLKQKKNRQ